MLLGHCRYRCVILLLVVGSLAPLMRENAPEKEKARTRIDAVEDPLPKGAIARFGTVRLRQPSEICSVAYSPDGKLLASGASNDGIRLWDAATGKLLHYLAAEAFQGIFYVSFSPDGKILVSGGTESGVEVWDVAATKKTHQLGKKPDCFNQPTFSRDGKFLAAIHLDTVRVWESAGWTECDPQRDGKKIAESFAGQRLYESNEKGDDHFWDLAALESRVVPRNWRTGYRAALTPDGRRMATSGWKAPLVVQRDAITGDEQFRIELVGEKDASVDALSYSPDGKLLAVGGTGIATRCFDSLTGKEAIRFDEPGGNFIAKLAFSPDGKKLAAACGQCIRLWDIESGEEAIPSRQMDWAVNALAFTPDGKKLALADDSGVRLVDLASRTETWRHKQSRERVHRIAFGADARTLIAGSYSRFRFFDAATGKVGGSWGEESHRFRVSDPSNIGIFSPTSRTIVSLDVAIFADPNLNVLVQSAKTGKEVLKFQREGKNATAVSVSPNGELLAIGQWEGNGHLYRLSTGKMLRTLNLADTAWHSLVFAPDGKTLVSSDKKGVRHLVEVATGQRRCAIDTKSEDDGDHVFSPDGNLLVTWEQRSGSHAAKVWDALTGSEFAQLSGHGGGVNDAAFSPDGKIVATASQDTTILFWDLAELVQQEKAVRLGAEALAAAWKELGDADAARAYRGMAALRGAGVQAVDFLRERLRPEQALTSEQVERWLKDLDSGRFAVREAAARELAQRIEFTEAAVRSALAGKPSFEMRRRLEQLVEIAEARPWTGESLRTLRAIEVLERIGSVEARGVLETLAGGVAEARLTKEAKASVERLKR